MVCTKGVGVYLFQISLFIKFQTSLQSILQEVNIYTVLLWTGMPKLQAIQSFISRFIFYRIFIQPQTCV